MKLLSNFKLSPEAKYILAFFLSTRIALTAIGVVSRNLLSPIANPDVMHSFSKHSWLNIWGVWDTGWYMKVANQLYPSSFDPNIESSWAFFPLYPLLMRLLGKIIGDTYIAGIIISNICLIITAHFLYKLVRLESDQETSLKAIKYLFLFPTSFILSGVFSESLFLCLLVACFYYGKKQNWLLAGILGFFLSLTRSLGVLIIIPLAYEYFKATGFNLKKAKLNILYLLWIPLGLAVFAAYSEHLTGNPITFLEAQNAWKRHLANPMEVLIASLNQKQMDFFFPGFCALTGLLIITFFYKKIRFSYWITGIYMILIPLSSGLVNGFPRFLTVIFPFHIIFARLSTNRLVDQSLTALLALLQGFLMVFWTNAFNIIV